jgi:hypothetical protein
MSLDLRNLVKTGRDGRIVGLGGSCVLHAGWDPFRCRLESFSIYSAPCWLGPGYGAGHASVSPRLNQTASENSAPTRSSFKCKGVASNASG